MSAEIADVVVVGGGIIGTSVAYYLTRAGARVCLVEREGLASGASGANVGLVILGNKIPGMRQQLFWDSGRAYETLSEELGTDVEYVRSGGVAVFLTEEQAAAGREIFDAQQRHGLPTELISADELRRREPLLVLPTLGALYCALDGHVNAFRVTCGYAAAAKRMGARILVGSEVIGVETGGGRVRGVVLRDGRIATEAVVNAAGCWSAEIGQMVGLEVPLRPCRGQVLITSRTPAYRGLVTMGVEPNAIQVVAGGVLIGSSPQFVGFDRRVDHETITEFARKAVRAFPFLENLTLLRCWAGLRPASPDGMPILGPAGPVEGFYLATGHHRIGVAIAPMTGKLMAEMVLGLPLSIDIRQCGLERFTAKGNGVVPPPAAPAPASTSPQFSAATDQGGSDHASSR